MKKMILSLMFILFVFVFTNCWYDEESNDKYYYVEFNMSGDCELVQIFNLDLTNSYIDLTKNDYNWSGYIVLKENTSREIKFYFLKAVDNGSTINAILYIDNQLVDSIYITTYNQMTELSYIIQY